ncbi:hypothetical protein JCM6882_005633 [Rhodosporidiobolus microsporus]
MPILGGTTQNFRSYGKRRTNVTNKRQPLGGWNASPDQAAASSLSSRRYEDNTDSSSSDSDDEEEVKVIKPQAKPVPSKKPVEKAPTRRTSTFEVVVEVPARRQSVGPPLTTSTAAMAKRRQSRGPAVDKENAAPPSPAPVKKKPLAVVSKMQGRSSGKGKADVIVLSSTTESEGERAAKKGKAATRAKTAQRTPLAPKARPSAASSVQAGKKPARTIVLEETTTEESEDVFPSRATAARGQAKPSKRRAPVVVSSDDEEAEEKVQVAETEESSDVEIVEEPTAPTWVDEPSSTDEDADDSILLVSPSLPSPRAAPRPKPAARVSSASTSSSQRTIRTPPRYSRASHSSSSTLTPLSALDTSTSSLGTPRPAPTPSRHPIPSLLSSLLPSLLTPTVLTFSSLLTSPPPPLAYFSDPLARPEWRKIGEASYSEVFETMGEEGGEVVVKIIPIAPDGGLSEEEQEQLPFMSEVGAVRREIEVSRLLGGEGGGVDGFARFKGAFVVQGAYPRQLLDSWDEYKAAQSPPCDDQIRPDALPAKQLYALILLENAGTDLETCKLRSWKEAASVWGQVVETVGAAEEQVGFEHRDLHWGNILLQPAAPSSPTLPSVTPRLNKRFSGLSLSYPTSSLRGTPPRRTLGGASSAVPAAKLDLSAEKSGIRATVIDFTLSRVEKKADGEGKERVLFDAFEDECVFEGEGDYQFDIYRSMRALVEQEGGGWEGAHFKTNVLWLHYLTLKLIHSKKLKPPAPLSSSTFASSAYSSFPHSPARAAPSPFRKARRPASLAAPPSPFRSPAPAAGRRSRTLPSAASRTGSSSQLTRAELEVEHRAYDALVKAEAVLAQAVERWGLEISPGRGKGRAKGKKTTVAAKRSARRKTRSTVEVEEDEGAEETTGDFASAAEVVRWWKTLLVQQ